MGMSLFAQLQALSTLKEDSTIVKSRKQLNKIVEFFKQREDYLDLVETMAECVRNLETKTLLDCDSFMVQDDFSIMELPEELQHDSLGFCNGNNVVFSGRYVYPVKDVKGDVMGFCGYDKFSSVKYLDSKNFGYQAKSYSCYGMEKLPEYYDSNEPVYFVEGIVCCLCIRQAGMQALAWLGSSISPYVTEIMRRFGTRAVAICDSDEAGVHTRKYIKRNLPLCRVLQSSVSKDVDDSRQVDPEFMNELQRMRNPFYRSTMLR